MKKLSEHLKEENANIDLKLAKETILSYKNWKQYNAFHYCHICGKQLSEERSKICRDDVNSFQVTCEEHDQYKNRYNISKVQRDLGLEEIINPFDI